VSEAAVIDWEGLASKGHAPAEGCSILGVGYEGAFDVLMEKYVQDRFDRGLSAEKFVVGPFGSGKTHFLRQLIELAGGRDCVTAEVKLNKDLDFTRRVILYSEIAENITAPGQPDHGMGGLLSAMLEKVRSSSPSPATADEFVEAWISGIVSADFKLDAFARAAQAAFEAISREDDAAFLAAQRWLSGAFHDRQLAKVLPVSAVPSVQQNLYASNALLSLFQLVRYAGFRGTVIGIDEAEQGFDVDRKRHDRILSMLKSDTDAIADLPRGSALVVYALTPEIREGMDQLPALQQRIADPGGIAFLDGNYLATVIDLSIRSDPVDHLRRIAERMLDLYVSENSLPAGESPTSSRERVIAIAEDVAASEPTSSNRRTLVKRVAAFLLGIPVAPDQVPSREF
jgi:hypothetical protein